MKTFADLLHIARRQPQPQRLLLVFAEAELPRDASDEERAAFARGEGGALRPVLCVDKAPDEIVDFASLREESTATGVPWSMMFVGALSGRAGHPPSSDEATQPLRFMVEAIKGGRIAEFLAVDAGGELVELQRH